MKFCVLQNLIRVETRHDFPNLKKKLPNKYEAFKCLQTYVEKRQQDNSQLISMRVRKVCRNKREHDMIISVRLFKSEQHIALISHRDGIRLDRFERVNVTVVLISRSTIIIEEIVIITSKKTAWKSVTSTTIPNCYRKAGFKKIDDEMIDEVIEREDDFDVLKVKWTSWFHDRFQFKDRICIRCIAIHLSFGCFYHSIVMLKHTPDAVAIFVCPRTAIL